MIERTDARVRRTRELLSTAVVELLAERDPANISITDITTAAGVSRPTFYLHYQDRDQLFGSVLRDRLDRLLERYTAGSLVSGDAAPPQLRDLLTDVAENHLLYRRLVGTDLAGPARRIVTDYLHDLVGRYVDRIRGELPPEVDAELLVRYIAGGMAAALSSWIDSAGAADRAERERFAGALWTLITHTGR